MCGNYNVTATRCGGLEPDVPEPVVPDCTDPASSLNFYRFHLVSHMVGRSDTTVRPLSSPPPKNKQTHKTRTHARTHTHTWRVRCSEDCSCVCEADGLCDQML